MTLRTVADALGVSTSYVCDVEKGSRQFQHKWRPALAKLFDVPVSRLMDPPVVCATARALAAFVLANPTTRIAVMSPDHESADRLTRDVLAEIERLHGATPERTP